MLFMRLGRLLTRRGFCSFKRMASPVLLSSGYHMPPIGLGTFQTDDEETAHKVLDAAIDAGYRLIDTAFVYKNESVLGKELQKMFQKEKIKREDLFITTKLPCNGLRAENVEHFFRKSLSALQLDYLDLYLIHAPVACQRTEDDDEVYPFRDGDVLTDNVDLVETWRAMESLVDKGLVRSIGLSNFNSRQIQRIYDASRIKPANLQVECHAYLQQYELLELCKNLNISFTAYAPLGSPGLADYMRKHTNMECKKAVLLKDTRLAAIAEKHGKTSAQILLRQLTQRGIIPIPQSSNPARIKENIEVFDFDLDEEDQTVLKTMESGLRYFTFDFAKSLRDHPEQPFNIAF